MVTTVLPAIPAAIARAADVIRHGGLVAFPTETVYGLGANALDASAVARIFAAKGRPAFNPLIVHGTDATAVRRVAADWPAIAGRLAERFWPGPLTLVLLKHPDLPTAVTAGGPTVAVRVPDHPVAQALLQAAGLPIAAPSANRSTELSPTTAAHVLRGLDGRIDLILDAGPTANGIESTVLDVTTSPPRLLRPGPVTVAQLEALISTVSRVIELDSQRPARSPGMMAKHYAPRVPLECVGDDGRERVQWWIDRGERVGWVPRGSEPEIPRAVTIRMPNDPAAYAARLYAALHELDIAAVDRIVLALPPDEPQWLAVRDRLGRAAIPAFGNSGRPPDSPLAK